MDKRKQYILNNWEAYNIVDSQEEMIKVLNILEAHNENLDTMHDVIMGNTEWLCGILIGSAPSTDGEVKDILYDFNCFYKTMEELKEDIRELAEECCNQSVDEFLEFEDIRQTSDGFVRVLYY